MADDEDDSQKTEDPSQKRLSDAQERGQVITSRETVSFAMIMAFTLMLTNVGPSLFHKAQLGLTSFIERPDTIAVDEEGLGILAHELLASIGSLLIIPFAGFIAAIIIANAVQNRFVFSLEPVVPKFEKVSIAKGLGRMFSMRSVVEFLKSLTKIVVVGYIAYYSVAPYLIHVTQLPSITIDGILAYLDTTAHKMLVGICIVMFFIAVVDYAFQRFEFLKGLRMSKQEQRDEYKQQEGDPQVKARLRQVRVERSRKRMMAAVPGADVIVTNPTHYSVALKYDGDSMRAPMVIAKGADNIALRIREVAIEHNIPIVENVALAQALYATVDIDREISGEHYKAVAEVISYVYRLKGKIMAPR